MKKLNIFTMITMSELLNLELSIFYNLFLHSSQEINLEMLFKIENNK